MKDIDWGKMLLKYCREGKLDCPNCGEQMDVENYYGGTLSDGSRRHSMFFVCPKCGLVSHLG